jgi:hypothetical protein
VTFQANWANLFSDPPVALVWGNPRYLASLLDPEALGPALLARQKDVSFNIQVAPSDATHQLSPQDRERLTRLDNRAACVQVLDWAPGVHAQLTEHARVGVTSSDWVVLPRERL